MIKGTLLEPLAWFAFVAIAVTGACGAAYVIVQQEYRTSLDDPQIQMSEDAAARLNAGAVPAEIVPHGTPIEDISQSLSPWLVVYDASGQALENTGQLDAMPPKLPAGLFDTSTWLKHPDGLFYNQSPILQTRFTWQPRTDVRQAVVLTQTSDKKYFIAAGRNMREVEQRIEHEGEIVFVAWLFTLVCLLVASFIGWWLLKPKN